MFRATRSPFSVFLTSTGQNQVGKGGFFGIFVTRKRGFSGNFDTKSCRLPWLPEKRAVSASRNVVSPLYYNATSSRRPRYSPPPAPPPSPLFPAALLLPPRRPSQLLTLRLRPPKRCFCRPLVPRSAAVVVLVRDAHTSCTCNIILRFFGIFVTIISRFSGIFCHLPEGYVLI